MHTHSHDDGEGSRPEIGPEIGQRSRASRWLPPIDSIDPMGGAGPVALSGSGRVVWWTGKVAIGLRYERALSAAAIRRGRAMVWVAA